MSQNYFSYLMRIWRSEDPLQGGWFASLEEPSTNKTLFFKTMEELFVFLDEISNENANKVTTQNQS